MSNTSLKPFLKWAGGKRWLFESSQFRCPAFSGTYIEPFLGGGAVFFSLIPHKAILGDFNHRLIETYMVVRDDFSELIGTLKHHHKSHSIEHYYKLRASIFDDKLERAAQFIYLNRTCWNGLYRENRKGEFNVPIGSKQKVLMDDDVFEKWSNALKNSELIHSDFEETIERSRYGDFIFVDPPYTVRHNMNGFVKYNQVIFAWEDQIRLRNALERAVSRGVKFAMTNADHESVKELYKGFGSHNQLGRFSVLAGNSVHRARSTELLVHS